MQKSADLDRLVAQGALDQRMTALGAEVRAVVDKAGAISPDLVAALQSFGDRAMVERVAESMAPLAILGGDSVVEVLAKLLRGTPLAKALGPKVEEPTNGSAKTA